MSLQTETRAEILEEVVGQALAALAARSEHSRNWTLRSASAPALLGRHGARG